MPGTPTATGKKLPTLPPIKPAPVSQITPRNSISVTLRSTTITGSIVTTVTEDGTSPVDAPGLQSTLSCSMYRVKVKATPLTSQTYAEAETEFRRRYPEVDKTAALGELRGTEFSRLDRAKHVYVDYTGGGLYAESQIQEHMRLLLENTFGNPHSTNPTSLAMTRLVEQTRLDVLRFFNVTPQEYDCIFTANASAALRIVGESYPFADGGHYLLPSDNHNSVNGIREFARAKGAKVTYIHTTFPTLRMDPDAVAAALEELDDGGPKLFAYPAQSNFSGVQHSLDFVAQAQASGWDVLLDAAAFAPTNKLDLRRVTPEFVSLSFYKIFGYPTGLGALLVRREALPKLSHRPWFAGGTIELAFVSTGKHWMHRDHEAFEDGTINYLSIPALSIGIRFIEKCGLDNIHARVMAMTSWFIEQLLLLKHSNGKMVVQIYGPQTKYSRGGTVALNCFDVNEVCISCWDIETIANTQSLSLRAGCFCNPGDSEVAFQWTPSQIEEATSKVENPTKRSFTREQTVAGAVRVSFGIATNFADVHNCVRFFASFSDKAQSEVAEAAVKAAVTTISKGADEPLSNGAANVLNQ